MNSQETYHRRGQPGGPGCRIGILPVQGRASDGTEIDGSLLDSGIEASEVELLRTVASGLGIRWGHDELGWWAVVPRAPVSRFIPVTRFGLYREDDNGARFLVGSFDSQEAAQRRAHELARGGHKQHYFTETIPAGEPSVAP